MKDIAHVQLLFSWLHNISLFKIILEYTFHRPQKKTPKNKIHAEECVGKCYKPLSYCEVAQ